MAEKSYKILPWIGLTRAVVAILALIITGSQYTKILIETG